MLYSGMCKGEGSTDNTRMSLIIRVGSITVTYISTPLGWLCLLAKASLHLGRVAFLLKALGRRGEI